MRRLFVVPLLFLVVLVPAAVAATGVPVPTVPARTDTGNPLSSSAAHAERVRGAANVNRHLARRAQRRRRAAAPAVPPALQAIAQCESGGNPRAISSNGTYRGKYQFSTATWAGVGGKGDPAAASEAEQDKRAAMLYARSGAGQWPVCGA
jgi:aminoglycoside phosphotransferase (APT) family kinase protein